MRWPDRIKQPPAPVTITTADGARRTVPASRLKPARRAATPFEPPAATTVRAGDIVHHRNTSTLEWTVASRRDTRVTLRTTIFTRPITWHAHVRQLTVIPPAPPSPPPPAVCHGFANGCACPACLERDPRNPDDDEEDDEHP